MSVELFIGFAALVLFAGIVWWYQTSRLAKRLFGSDHRLRYVHQRWVIESVADDRSVKYAMGGMGLFPALTYLLVESPVSAEFCVTEDQATDALPEEIRTHLDALTRKEGFKRLDVVREGASLVDTAGRVSWLHPGEGILLRRHTKSGGDESFVKDDLEVLQRIADQLQS